MTAPDIYPDDRFIVSYPKSGNTWVRFFLANVLSKSEEVDFLNLDGIVPDIYKVHAQALASLDRPRHLKSHGPFNPRYPTVVYLVRDVRAVVPSYYRQRLRMGMITDGLSMDQFVRSFIEGSVSSLPTWDVHIRGWLDKGGKADQAFRVVRYEDILRNPLKEFRRILDFLAIDCDESRFGKAVASSSFDRMRMLEGIAGVRWREKIEAKDLSIPFMFAGTVDSWKSELSKQSEALLIDRYGEILRELDYSL